MLSVPRDVAALDILKYPDPRLRARCVPVREFDERLAALAARMFELMRREGGVGLAAAQVGVGLRMFITNVGGDPANDLVFVNPSIRDPQGTREAEEGCLSIPDVRVQVRRHARCRIVARDLRGEPFELEDADLACRAWQHEIDHLDGVLIIDRMGPADRIATRRLLRELEAAHKRRSRA